VDLFHGLSAYIIELQRKERNIVKIISKQSEVLRKNVKLIFVVSVVKRMFLGFIKAIYLHVKSIVIFFQRKPKI